jgi:hypothetical protein
VGTLAALVESSSSPRTDPSDSKRLVEAALYHRVAGYLARAVERGEVRLDRQERGRLARIGAVHILHSTALRRELGAIEPVLTAACGAAPVCIKGPAVADRFYPNPRLRTFADLDLLVPRATLDDAARALVARGYERVHEFSPGFGQSHGHDLHLRRRIGDRSLDVELHWRVGDDPACAALDYHRFDGGPRMRLNGAEVSVPEPAEQLLCLAVHLLSDRSKRLIWVADLAQAGAQASDSDWSQAFELSRELELGWALHHGLDYAARHLHFERERPLPPGRPPAWGPLRAVEELDLRASLHVGRLAVLGWRARLRYLREVLAPTAAGLSGTVGRDGAPTARLVRRHLRAIALGLRPNRR